MWPNTFRDTVVASTSRRGRIPCLTGEKNWIKWFSGTLSLTVFCVFLPAQSAQSGTDRVTFAGSIKGVAIEATPSAAVLSAQVVRSELTPTEYQATLGFSVALQMHNFAELQERVGKGEIISVDEMTARYYPTPADYKSVADWLISQGFNVKPPDKYNLSVFANGTVTQIERAFATKFARVIFSGLESSSALTTPSMPAEVATSVLGINGLQPYLHPKSHSYISTEQLRKL